MKTLTLKETNEKGDYLLYSGKDKKRRRDLFGIYGDKIYFPRKKESIPIIKLGMQKDSNLRVIFGYYMTNKYEPIFGETYQNKGNKEQPIMNGKQLKKIHRFLQMLNKSNKIPYEPKYTGGGLIGDSICTGIGIDESPYYNISNFIMGENDSKVHMAWSRSLFNNNSLMPYPKYIKRIFGISQVELNKILENYDFPSDDSNKEIKESDLIRLILK